MHYCNKALYFVSLEILAICDEIYVLPGKQDISFQE